MPVSPSNVTVPVPSVNVPVFAQFPVSLIVPVDNIKVPAFVRSPDILRVPVATLNVEPDGIVIPAEYNQPGLPINNKIVIRNIMFFLYTGLTEYLPLLLDFPKFYI